MGRKPGAMPHGVQIARGPVLPTNIFFLDHVRWLRWAAREHGVEVLIELESMRAFLRKGALHWVLTPQFLTQIDGRQSYVRTFSDTSTHFAGWRPEATQVSWPASKHKLVFKRAAAGLGIAVPEFALDDQQEMKDVVVKRAVGSFGEHVYGPFRSSAERPLQVEQGEYYERFIEGELLKVWYWGDRAVGLECDPMPTVVGDGKSTLNELILMRLTGFGLAEQRIARTIERFKTVVAYDGYTLADILPAGQRQRAEFRYGSDLMQRPERKIVDLRQDVAAEWQALVSMAPLLHQLLPADLPVPVLYAIDAVRDEQGRIFVLEMNSNPFGNPLVYRLMLQSLLSRRAPISPAVEAVRSSIN